jgi:DNA (cytosine-5)-methyltransferase 1
MEIIDDTISGCSNGGIQRPICESNEMRGRAVQMVIPVIDLFAGPGGLGEGFSSLRGEAGNPLFRIRLSVEKDPHAHKTLELRSFFRQFPDGEVPEEYYSYIRGEGITREELFTKYNEQAEAARKEAWCFELKEDSAKEIDERIDDALDGGKVWVLIGGPPCQAYSVVGRVRMCGQDREKYENDPRHNLYREYLRILATHRPPVFVFENVPGLMSSQKNGEGIFGKILKDLSLSQDGKEGYRLFPLKRTTRKIRNSDFVVHAEKHGIPQRRHRLIIVGIRSDLDIEPELIDVQEGLSTVLDAIQDLPALRSGLSKEADSLPKWNQIIHAFAEEMKRADCATQDLLQEFAEVCANENVLNTGAEFVSVNGSYRFSDWLCERTWWFIDEKLKGYCNHSARSHIRQDICRYFFAACYAKARCISPRMSDFPESLLPAHRNIADAVAGRLFSDRFRVQTANSPSTTVVSHISKDGHYFIHPDPKQCRSLTVRESYPFHLRITTGTARARTHFPKTSCLPPKASDCAPLCKVGRREGFH